jgi:hypothetical protein
MQMDSTDRKTHWDKIYELKNTDQVSWYQATPASSLNFVKQFNLSMSAKFIDIGGGDSLFVTIFLSLVTMILRCWTFLKLRKIS